MITLTEEKQEQERGLIFALDIGTRSIIGVLGRVEDERLKVLAIESEEHSKRAMLDGQIEDIEQVARLARLVTHRLEEKYGCKLTRVCVAAAGRALRTERASFQMTLPAVRQIDDELIGRLEAGAVSEAESQLARDQNDKRRFYLVGYTVVQYQLDHYPLTTLRGHNGQELEAEVVATFLPSEVVESLYSSMHQAGLEVASLTLEPIAALNAAIPAELRLLNLVLADIGAGTSDIAVCREGSVVGYTMATVAGDEITETLMKAYLVDFKTAERIKAAMSEEEAVAFTDILGLEQCVPIDELRKTVTESSGQLAREIASRILEVNGGPPSALFLAGGGSKLDGLRRMMADSLGMDERRVAVAGNNFQISAFSEDYDLNNPEYATPLGIAVSAGLGLVSDSYMVMLNGHSAKLFRSGTLTVLDILMMNGYTYADLIGRTGQSLTVTLDGERVAFRGEPAQPSVLRMGGREVTPTTVVHAGDSITFIPAVQGACAARTLGQLLGEDFTGEAWVNGQVMAADTPLKTGDIIFTGPPAPQEPQEPQEQAPALPQDAAETRDEAPAAETRDEAPAAETPAQVVTSVAETPAQDEAPAAETPTQAVTPAAEAPAQAAAPATETPVQAAASVAETPTQAVTPVAEAPTQAAAPAAETQPETTAPAPEKTIPRPAQDADQLKDGQTSGAEKPSGQAGGQPQSQADPAKDAVPQAIRDAQERAAAERKWNADMPVFVLLNGTPMTLQPKPERVPYYLMDLLHFSGLDFKNLQRPVVLEVNGAPGAFTQVILPGDVVSIRCEE